VFLEIDSVVKRFGEIPALNGIDLAVDQGMTVALLGPSGSGKSTLLRVIAGLEASHQGEVRLEGRSLSGTSISDRGFGLMFQDLALFPHLNVSDNISFGLRMRRWSSDAARARVHELGDLARIGHLLERRVDELSGGEQQRVALARSLAPRPSLLMLDEPLGSLDRTLRDELIDEIRRILRDEGVTALYVTHDQEEAFAVADRVALLNDGRVAQEGRPAEVYFAPVSGFVARFLGHRNLFPATAISSFGDTVTVESPLGTWTLRAPAGRISADAGVVNGIGTLLIPVDAVSIQAGDGTGQGLAGFVDDLSWRAGRYIIKVQLTVSGGVLVGSVPAIQSSWIPVRGDPVSAIVEFGAVRLLPWREA
jgi:ABC-type Fe3+/spermidine/putrescine transport system ATPase subunit